MGGEQVMIRLLPDGFPERLNFGKNSGTGIINFREVLPRITIPVLLVYAAPGSIYYEAIGRYVESRIPDTRFLLIEDATHMFTPEQNRQYIQAVCEFAG